MILISNHLLSLDGFILPDDSVLRVNLAYVKDETELESILYKTDMDVFLDFPKDRKKPPIGKISLTSAIDIANTHEKIKYFAISNVEEPCSIETIRGCVEERVSVVPKIETVKGVLRLQEIIDKARPVCVMLDTEDLFTDVSNVDDFTSMCSKVEDVCNKNNVGLLKLWGVVFCDTMHS